MSADSVRREIAAKRAYAEQLEARANDAEHASAESTHRRQHLLAEAARLRADAERQEAQLAAPRHHFR